MARLRRITNKIFGKNATAIGDNPDIGQFGSALAGTYIGTTDVETIQALPAWEQGWIGAVTPTQQFPALPERTGVDKVLSYQTGYLMQEGIAEWDENTVYYKGSLVKKYDDDNGLQLYVSIADNNQGNALDSSEHWELASIGGGGGLEIGDIGTALYIDETKGKRRRLNGSLLAINNNTTGFLNWLKSIITTAPSLATTEQNWQAEANNSAFGQCGKFVIDEENATIRLPKVVNIQGLQDLSKAGVTVPAKLPNIIGTFYGGGAESGCVTGTSAGVFIQGTNTPTSFHHQFETINASNSSSIYQDGATVQQEAVLYPYFIQIATGAETEVDIINTIELNNPFSLFDSKYSDHELFNVSWLRAQGQYNSKAVYVKAYEALAVENNEEVEIGETVELPSGTQYTKQGLSVKLSTETFTDYDFVLNTSDETFRLPIKTNLASGKAVVGNGMTLGLTDGTHFGGIAEYSGIIKAIDAYGAMVGTSHSTESSLVNNIMAGITTDPTKSGIELADSNLYLYYYVGETVQNANLIDAGRIAEDVANVKNAIIIDEYVNGTSGYRIWASGYCEQWGCYNFTGTHGASYTINLLKTMKDTNYLTYRGGTFAFGAVSGIFVSEISKTATNFVVQYVSQTGGSYNVVYNWKACGYLAEGEY